MKRSILCGVCVFFLCLSARARVSLATSFFRARISELSGNVGWLVDENSVRRPKSFYCQHRSAKNQIHNQNLSCQLCAELDFLTGFSFRLFPFISFIVSIDECAHTHTSERMGERKKEKKEYMHANTIKFLSLSRQRIFLFKSFCTRELVLYICSHHFDSSLLNLLTINP